MAKIIDYTKQTGCIPSPVDKRDVLASQVSPFVQRIPAECPPPFDLEILDQKTEPSCVAFATCAVKQERELRERIVETFDGSWLYARCKETDGLPNLAGTFIRQGLKMAQKLGVKPLNKPESEAYKYRIGGYALVDGLLEGLKKAVFVSGAVVAGYTGSNAGWQSKTIRPPKAGEPTWNHAVAIIGYTKDQLIIQNSWGKNAGDKGLFYVPKDYLPFESWQILSDFPTEQLGVEAGSGYIAMNSDWTTDNKTLVRINLRTAPSLTAGVIKVLPVGTPIQIISYEKYQDNYHWLKVKVV